VRQNAAHAHAGGKVLKLHGSLSFLGLV